MPVLSAEDIRSEDEIQGKSRPVAGKYHAVVVAAEEILSKKKNTPGLQVEFEIVADGLPPAGKGTTVNQSGKKIPLFLSYLGSDDEKTATCISRVTRLAMALGVLQSGERKEVDWNDAIGCELVLEVVEAKYVDANGNEKASTEVSFLGFWSLGNKLVKDVPRDLQTPWMQALGRGQAGGKPAPVASDGHTGGNGSNHGKPAASASKSKYADL